MAVLKGASECRIWAALIALLAILPRLGRAAVAESAEQAHGHLIHGIEATINGSGGIPSTYSGGGSGMLRLGSEEDPASHTGELHFNFSSTASPIDSTDPSSAYRFANSWLGGATIDISPELSLGMELDTLIDPTSSLKTDGTKISLGYGAWRFSYRYARSVISQVFSLTNPTPPPANLNFDGATMYQQAPEIEWNISLGKRDLLSLRGTYTFFQPDSQAFANLITNSFGGQLSNFRDILQSFEQWSMNVDWKHQFTNAWAITGWDTELSASLSHLVLYPGIAVSTVVALGYTASQAIHFQIGWNYSHDPSPYQVNTATFELRYAWEREPPPN